MFIDQIKIATMVSGVCMISRVSDSRFYDYKEVV